MISPAIEDANFNAKLNNIQEKCKFFVGRAQCVLSEIVSSQLKGNDIKIVGIVDPPRAGLHKDVISAIRTCRGLDRLVYVACNPNSMAQNLFNLCTPSSKKVKGPAFIPLRSVGADFFPGTKHVETIVFLERETLFQEYF